LGLALLLSASASAGAGNRAPRGLLPAGSIGPRVVVAGPSLSRLPLARLLPAGAHLYNHWPIRASGGEPPQMLVMWRTWVLAAPKGGKQYPNLLYRLVLWTRTTRASATEWRWSAYGVLVAGAPEQSYFEQLRLVDLTGDGHPEVISHYVEGNHNIGPFKVIATLHGRPRCVLCAASWIETYWHIRDGILHFESADYTHAQALCCPPGEFHTTYRWNGRRLAATHRTRTANQYG
jgi:hypothetical protein